MVRTSAFALVLLAAGLTRNPDLIISTHLNFGPVACWLNCIRRTRYILVAHGVEVSRELSSSRLRALRRADQVWAVSEWTRQRLIHLTGVEASKISLLPNTYDDSRFTAGSKPASLNVRYGLEPDEQVILTVARLAASEAYKGYDRLLQAMPAILERGKSVRLIIAGKGDDRQRLESLARDLGIAERVTFAGFVPDEELADHYRMADVFAMPSTGEGFGIVFLEAMGCGTPVLAGNQDGSVDALADGELGLLVNPTDVSAIAEGIIQLLDRRGPALWFDREALSKEVHRRFGRAAFQARVKELMESFQQAQ